MTASPDVYKRWLQFGLLSTHSRLHGSKSYRVPWLYDEEAVEVCRRFTKLKIKLMPYIFQNAVNSHQTGIPSMRAMVMEFDKDPAVKYLDMQYMLGDSLLVAPVFSEDGKVEYYLPKGIWTHLFTGERKQGGTWYEETYDFLSLPLFVRENTLLAVGANEQTASYDFAKGVQIQVYELLENEMASCIVPDRQGNSKLFVTAERKGKQIVLKASYLEDMSYLLRNIYDVKQVLGGEIKDRTEQGIVLLPQKERIMIEL